MSKRNQPEMYVPPTKKTAIQESSCLHTVKSNVFFVVTVRQDPKLHAWPFVYIRFVADSSDTCDWVTVGNQRANFTEFTDRVNQAVADEGWVLLDTSQKAMGSLIFAPTCHENTTAQLAFAQHLVSFVRYESFVPSLKAMAMASLRHNPQRSVSLFIDHMTGGAAKLISAEGVPPWTNTKAPLRLRGRKSATQSKSKLPAESSSSSSSTESSSTWFDIDSCW